MMLKHPWICSVNWGDETQMKPPAYFFLRKKELCSLQLSSPNIWNSWEKMTATYQERRGKEQEGDAGAWETENAFASIWRLW